MEQLLELGADLTYHDPFVPVLPSMRHHNLPAMNSNELTAEFLAKQDVVLISTDHDDVDYDFVAQHSKLIVDTRNAMNGSSPGLARIVKA